ncbi:MAG: hypothetical protein GF307_09020, partial [candidate division Zixibacteria bacterium]|nr:hypothetical protein [candidate division Zixibacteria bacterium]
MSWRSDISDIRARNVIIFFVFIFLILAGRLFSIQIISHSHYEEISENNSVRMVPVAAPRGFIRDRN